MYQAQRYFHTLELDKVLAKLADQANCDDSKRMALSLTPSDDFSTVQLLMKKTSDAYMLSARYTSPSLHKLKNCEMALRKAEKGSNLSLRELMDVSSVLHNIRSVKDWRKRCEGESTSLDPLFEVLTPNRELENTIDNAVLSEEELADSASAELASLRRKINQAKLRVRERLDQLIKSPTQSKYLQEALVTQRDGRFVVPVKSEYRSEIKGLVHDTSSSGATLSSSRWQSLRQTMRFGCFRQRKSRKWTELSWSFRSRWASLPSRLFTAIARWSKSTCILQRHPWLIR